MKYISTPPALSKLLRSMFAHDSDLNRLLPLNTYQRWLVFLAIVAKITVNRETTVNSKPQIPKKIQDTIIKSISFQKKLNSNNINQILYKLIRPLL